MNKRNTYWIIAGLLNLFTAFIHTIAGQLDLVDPLLDSNLTDQAKTEWLGGWHAITIVLFLTSYYLLRSGFGKDAIASRELKKFIGILYSLFGVAFIIASLWMKVLAPQWILLVPIGVLTIIGLRKERATAS